jgi:hypothetical protein
MLDAGRGRYYPFTIPHLPFTIYVVKLVQLSIALASIILTASCGGSLFKVKPVVELPPLPAGARAASTGGMSLTVAPLLSDEESQELFEANLPLSGVLPVRVVLKYESGVPLELKRGRFVLRDGQGQTWKLLSPKQATSRIMKANGVFAYNPNSRKQFEKEFGAYELDIKTPLTPNERSREGFLFFASPKNEPISSPTGLVLKLERIPQPIELALN